jgi:hypothetical protein
MTSRHSSARRSASAGTVVLASMLMTWVPAEASAELIQARLGSSPSVEPLTAGPRRFAPLPQGDSQRLRRPDISPRCTYIRGRRVCR